LDRTVFVIQASLANAVGCAPPDSHAHDDCDDCDDCDELPPTWRSAISLMASAERSDLEPTPCMGEAEPQAWDLCRKSTFVDAWCSGIRNQHFVR
jgi:hypothetical protein